MKIMLFATILIMSSTVLGQTLPKQCAGLFAPQNKKLLEERTVVLQKLLDQTQILMLGESNHQYLTMYASIKDLLEHGDVSKVKYLIIEYPKSETRHFWETLSLNSLERTLEMIPDGLGWKKMIAEYADLRFKVEEIMPLVRDINKKRKNPLIVTSIDGSLNRFPIKGLTLEEGMNYNSSYLREQRTADSFLDLLQTLQPGEKIVLGYHVAHIIPGINGGLKLTNEVNARHADLPGSWFSEIVRRDPAMLKKTSLVIFDESNSRWAPNGTFNFSKNFMKANKDRSIARSSSFNYPKIKLEFEPETMVKPLSKDFNFWQIFDHYFWTSNAEARFPESLEN